jgi:D-arabinose 1-dehydrogenase-like Zn-dependent alcohol dehydrogenase
VGRGDRLGGADRTPSSDRRRLGFDAGFGRRLGLCAAIRPAFGRQSDRDDLDRGKGRAAQGAGASEVINYAETPDWDEKARELTDGRGVDCIVEIGGPGTIAKSLKALAVGGHVSLIGASLSPSGTMLDP